jgi:ABC-type Fe3+-siderophore transport system permease subunit
MERTMIVQAVINLTHPKEVCQVVRWGMGTLTVTRRETLLSTITVVTMLMLLVLLNQKLITSWTHSTLRKE